ncbi:hypothetical protein ACN3XK_55660 [Actinomadura welshii]
MSSGARHGLGVLIGVVATPVVAACLMYGTTKLALFARTFRFEGTDKWVGAAVLIVAAVVIGLVAGSRLSPLASLVPGAVFSVLGLVWIVAPRWAFTNSGRDVLPRELENGYLYLGPFGIFLVLGVGLLVASLAPSRWKSLRAAPAYGSPPPAPMGPPPMHGSAPPMSGQQPPPAPPGPSQSPPPWQGAPQYGQQQHGQPQHGQPQHGQPQHGQAPAQPGPANPPPLPSTPPASPPPPADDRPEPARSDSDDDKPGDWTQMYGGGNRPT